MSIEQRLLVLEGALCELATRAAQPGIAERISTAMHEIRNAEAASTIDAGDAAGRRAVAAGDNPDYAAAASPAPTVAPGIAAGD